MSLGEWLDDAIVERAAVQGVDPEDFDSEDRLDAIADRLSSLSRRDVDRVRRRRPETEEEEPAVRRLVSREETRRAEDLLEAAITRFEARAAKNEERTARALDSFAEWIEKSRNNTEHAEQRVSESLAERLEAIESRIAKRHSEAVGRASDALAERLGAIETQIAKRIEVETSQRSPARVEEALNAMRQVESAARDLDKRMADLAQRMDETERQRSASRPRIDLAQAVSQIARRRQALDSGTGVAASPEPVKTEASASGGWRNFGVDMPAPPPLEAARKDKTTSDLHVELQRLNQRLDELRRDQSEKRATPDADLGGLRGELQRLNQRLDELRRDQSEKRATPGADVAALRAELQPLNQRLDELRRDQSEKRATPGADVAALRAELQPLNQRLDEMRRDQRAAPSADLAALRSELTGMSSALAELAPRNAVIAIEGAVRDLSDRVAALRDHTLRESLGKPVDEIIAGIRETLHAHDPRKAVVNLERDIGAIRDRLDALARTRVDPDVLERIRQQTEEVRAMLSAAAQRPMPVDRLERQIGELADRVDHLASSRSPHIDSAQVVASLANARAEIERSTPALALNVIERRLEDIASKIDQAIARSQSTSSIGAKAVEELARRIDSVRETIETRHPLPIVSASLEATMRDLTAKLQDAQAPRLDTEPLEAWMREVSEKLDAARPVSLDTARFEGSLQELIAKAAVAQSPSFDKAPLEAWMREVSEKLERAGAAGGDARQLEAWMREVSEKLERAGAAGLNARQLEAWMREVSEKLETARPITLDTKPLESWMREVSEKLERPNAAGLNARQLEEWMREVSEKLDSARPVSVDAGHFENSIRDLAAKLEDAQTPSFDKAPLEAWMREVSEKLETARPIALDTKPLEGWMRELTAKLDSVKPAGIDTKPLEDTLRSIDIKLSQAAAPRFESALVDQTAQALAREIEARIKPSADIRAIEGLLRSLEDKLEQVGGGGAPESFGALRDQVGQFSAKLDEMRESVRTAQAAMSERGERGGLSVLDLENLRATQEASERRVQTTLSGVHALLEKLVDRLARIEDDVVRTNRPPVDTPRGATPPALPAIGSDDFEVAPPRKTVAAPPVAPPPIAPAPRVAVGQSRVSDAPDFLIEPGSGAPVAALGKDANGAVPPKAAVNAHIAAARRAAQAAMAEAPNEGGAPGKNVVTAADASTAGHPIAQARAFINARRRPILLGLAFVILGAIAVIELGAMYVVKTQKSDITTSAPAPAKGASETPSKSDTPPKSDLAQKSDARALDPTPTGAIALPAASLPAERKPPVPAPADLVALIPSSAPKALRDLAASGDSAAQYELASRLFEGRGIPRDMHAASQWFERAAIQDFAPAQYRLGACYDKGNGVERDLAAAKVWYEKAATAGNIRAMHNLAVLLAEGPGVKPDYAEASLWFQKAAQYGVKDSQYNLAILYARGMGVPLDLNQSWLWFSLAAQQGDTDAAKKRDDVAAKLDANALATDGAALAAFKPRQANTFANDVKAPDGGWDGKVPGQATDAPSKPTRPPTAL